MSFANERACISRGGARACFGSAGGVESRPALAAPKSDPLETRPTCSCDFGNVYWHFERPAATGQVGAAEGMYEFKVDLNGNSVEEITCRIKFDERDANGGQRLDLHRIEGAQAADPHATGTLLLKGATGEKSPAQPALVSGREGREIHSGSSPMCCMRKGMRLGWHINSFRTCCPTRSGHQRCSVSATGTAAL